MAVIHGRHCCYSVTLDRPLALRAELCSTTSCGGGNPVDLDLQCLRRLQTHRLFLELMPWLLDG